VLLKPETRARIAGLRGFLHGPGLDRESIKNFQEQRLRALVQHAYNRVPYYRRLFDQARLKPGQIGGLDDLARIPITSRADLQSLPASETVASGFVPDKLIVHRTSGSSGEPLSIRRTWFEDRLLQAYRLRVLFRLGMRITDRRVAVVTPRMAGIPLYMKLGVLRYEEIHCLWEPDRILSRLCEARPDVIRGFPGTLSWLAGYVTDRERSRIRPRFIATDSEMMTGDMRSRIREGFGAKIIDSYDSHEFNLIASECARAGQYHVSDSSVIAEIVRDGNSVRAGEDGELVATALHSWAMPFIRLRLGDLVTRGEDRCSCGAPNSVIAHVQGRIVDRFHLPGGRSVHPYVLVNPLLKSAPWLRQYQIIQEKRNHIRVKLVPMPGSAPQSETAAAISRTLTQRLGGEVRVEIELVGRILPRPNGKFAPYYSLVPSDSASRSVEPDIPLLLASGLGRSAPQAELPPAC